MLIFLSDSCGGSEELAKRADAALAAVGKPLIKEIKKKESGAPYCDNYYISVTHTDGVVMLALSDKPVGIDAEKSDRKVPETMKDIFNWTAYEAKCKLSADGIKLSEVRAGGDYTDGVSFHTFLRGYVLAIAGGDKDLFVVCV